MTKYRDLNNIFKITIEPVNNNYQDDNRIKLAINQILHDKLLDGIYLRITNDRIDRVYV